MTFGRPYDAVSLGICIIVSFLFIVAAIRDMKRTGTRGGLVAIVLMLLCGIIVAAKLWKAGDFRPLTGFLNSLMIAFLIVTRGRFSQLLAPEKRRKRGLSPSTAVCLYAIALGIAHIILAFVID